MEQNVNSKNYWAAAMNLFEGEQYDAAKDKFQQYLDYNPTSYEAIYYIALCGWFKTGTYRNGDNLVKHIDSSLLYVRKVARDNTLSDEEKSAKIDSASKKALRMHLLNWFYDAFHDSEIYKNEQQAFGDIKTKDHNLEAGFARAASSFRSWADEHREGYLTTLKKVSDKYLDFLDEIVGIQNDNEKTVSDKTVLHLIKELKLFIPAWNKPFEIKEYFEYYTKKYYYSDGLYSHDPNSPIEVKRRTYSAKAPANLIDAVNDFENELLQFESTYELKSLLEDGKYEQARTLLDKIEMDVSEKYAYRQMLDEKIYEQKISEAKKAMSQGRYKQARDILSLLRLSADDVALLMECNEKLAEQEYSAAQALFLSGKYSEAKAAFLQLGTYKDSQKYVGDCDEMLSEEKYQIAQRCMSNSEYVQAVELFTQLGAYKDSNSCLEKAKNGLNEQKYLNAKKLYDDGKYKASMKEFISCGGYKDSAQWAESCQYNINNELYIEAINDFNNEDFLSASTKFEKLGEFSQAKFYLEKCQSKLNKRGRGKSSKKGSKLNKRGRGKSSKKGSKGILKGVKGGIVKAIKIILIIIAAFAALSFLAAPREMIYLLKSLFS